MINSDNIAYEVDVWETVEEVLGTGVKNVLSLFFLYENGTSVVTIKHPKNSEIDTKKIELDSDDSLELIQALGDRFHFRWLNLIRLSFYLSPSDIPTFNASYYPYVSEPTKLNQRKSRMNPITVD